MRVVIVGCGRSGSTLATELEAEGMEVAVVDCQPEASQALPRGFRGTFHAGDGLDRSVLEAAGVPHADALVALTGNDSLNVVCARAAREIFRVPHVVGRLQAAELLPTAMEMGIPMLCLSRMTADRIHRMLTHRPLHAEHTFGNGETLLLRSPIPPYLAGRPVSEFNVPGEIQVVEMTRGGRSSIPGSRTAMRPGDVLSFVVASASLGRLRGFLGASVPS